MRWKGPKTSSLFQILQGMEGILCSAINSWFYKWNYEEKKPVFSIYIEVCLPQYSIIWPLESATIPQYPDHTYRQYSLPVYVSFWSCDSLIPLLDSPCFGLVRNLKLSLRGVGMGHTFWDWCYYKYRPASFVRSHLENLTVRLFSRLFVCWFMSSIVFSSNRAQSSSGAQGAPGLLAHLMCIINSIAHHVGNAIAHTVAHSIFRIAAASHNRKSIFSHGVSS